MKYSALIRVDRCDDLLRRVVDALRAQTRPPERLIFVDSSRSSSVREQLLLLGDGVVDYDREDFNFSRAINLGVAAIDSPLVLIISAHVLFSSSHVISEATDLAVRFNSLIFHVRSSRRGELEGRAVDWRRFDGSNGLSNTCAMIPVELLRKRPFREEVFSAEDQEWAAWYLRESGLCTVCVDHPGMCYMNPHVNALKYINEVISIAYFSKRRNLWPDHVAIRLMRAALALTRGRHDRAYMHFEIAKGLVSSWFKAPVRRSRYH